MGSDAGTLMNGIGILIKDPRQLRGLSKQELLADSGLPTWSSGKEFACQCRGHGFDPWSGKIPHAVEQLSLCATSIEPVLQSLQVTTAEPVCGDY